jgi:hypothetical protein
MRLANSKSEMLASDVCISLTISPSLHPRSHSLVATRRLQALRRCMPSTGCDNYERISSCSYPQVPILTYLGTNGAILMSTIRRASNPNTRKRESTHAFSALRPIFAVPDMCHELAVLVRMCSWDQFISIVKPISRQHLIRTQIASSESSAGIYVFKVFAAYTGAERRRFVTFIPSIRTRRSKAWLRKLGSIKGAAKGSFDCSRTEPLL